MQIINTDAALFYISLKVVHYKYLKCLSNIILSYCILVDVGGIPGGGDGNLVIVKLFHI